MGSDGFLVCPYFKITKRARDLLLPFSILFATKENNYKMFKRLKLKKASKYLSTKTLYSWKNNTSAKDVLFGLMRCLDIKPVHYKSEEEVSQAMVSIIYQMTFPQTNDGDKMEDKYYLNFLDKSYYRYQKRYHTIRRDYVLAAYLEITEMIYVFCLEPTEQYLFRFLSNVKEYINSSYNRNIFKILNSKQIIFLISSHKTILIICLF